MQVFNTAEERNAYAVKCIQAGVDPERVAAELGYRQASPVKQPLTMAESNYHKHLVAKLKAFHTLPGFGAKVGPMKKQPGVVDMAVCGRCKKQFSSTQKAPHPRQRVTEQT